MDGEGEKRRASPPPKDLTSRQPSPLSSKSPALAVFYPLPLFIHCSKSISNTCISGSLPYPMSTSPSLHPKHCVSPWQLITVYLALCSWAFIHSFHQRRSSICLLHDKLLDQKQCLAFLSILCSFSHSVLHITDGTILPHFLSIYCDFLLPACVYPLCPF